MHTFCQHYFYAAAIAGQQETLEEGWRSITDHRRLRKVGDQEALSSAEQRPLGFSPYAFY